MIKAPKKLIEVALPLEAINAAAAYEKLPGIGAHPRGIHHWWARRPFGAARAILFAQMVNDPGGERGWGNYPGQTKEDAQRERDALFVIVRELANWKNSENKELLKKAQKEICKSWRETCKMNEGRPGFDPDNLPAFHDPFAGGGAIPLEAQRLGLEAYASDLNPVAVMINKAMIEIPPKFAGRKPVSLNKRDKRKRDKAFPGFEYDWPGATGLAEDVRYYGQMMRDEAEKRIGHLYPQAEVTPEMAEERSDLKDLVGQKFTVIAWLWARTVKSPNPAFSHVDVPLIKSFVLSTKKGKRTWLKPIVHGDQYQFEVMRGDFPAEAKKGTKLARGAKFRCILSNAPMEPKYIKSEGKAGRMGQRMIAVVAAGCKERIYLPATEEMAKNVAFVEPSWKPATPMTKNPRWFSPPDYGFPTYGDIFTPRQLTALTTFSDLVKEIREKVIADAKDAGWEDDGIGLNDGGKGATAYGDSVAVYLAFAIDRSTDFNNSLTGWRPANEKIMGLFNRQAIPMVWDFGEANIIEKVVGGFPAILEYQAKCIEKIVQCKQGYSLQADVGNQNISQGKIISTDPPYYDNIGYADLSDFFYVWQRRALRRFFPDIYATMTTPKEKELIASPYRHGGKAKAETFFMNGMTKGLKNLAEQASPVFPITIYYAFKQNANTASTGWETFLDALLKAGFSITGTWPMRSEQSTRMIGMGANALASSIVLVCRKRAKDASTVSRREFQRELKRMLPEALEAMIGGGDGASPIAPADLAQAAIGPGMAVFSQYQAVLEADGTSMRVHDALVQINREIDAYFNAAEGELDSDSRFCLDWFQQYGFKAGPFGEADVLARAKGTSVDDVALAGVIASGRGSVRLLTFGDYPRDWDPDKDPRIPIWEATHQLIRALRQGGERPSGALLARLRDKTEVIRQIAYRLYTLCERRKWAEEARAYNELICSWHAIVSASEATGVRGEQIGLF